MPHLEHNGLTLLLLQIILIVTLSRVLAAVTRRIGQPAVIAEVIAGILLGPSLLGLLWPEALAFVFPRQSMPSLKMLSQFGLILFMFLVGLEFNPKLLKGRGHSSVVISHTSIIVPFALGAGLGLVLYRTHASPETSWISFVLFLGISMSVTAFPVLARILSERNLLTSRVGAIAIACAAVDDVTAWCLLAFVVAVAKARALSDAAWTTGLALAYVALMLFVARPFLRRLGRRVIGPEGLTPTVAVLCLVMLLLSAGLTELIGIHALFGAFLLGAVLPKEGALSTVLSDKLELVATTLLLPLFFAYSGLRTEIGLLNTPGEWALTAVIILLATVGKFGGSTLAARFTGMRWREATAIGVLMNTRGLMELIVLNIGLDLGVISPQVFTMMVVMALVTTFLTTPILRWVYPDSQLALDRLEPHPVTAPALPAFGVLMCVSDERSGAGMAVLADALIATDRREARLTALHLQPPSSLANSLHSAEAAPSDGPLGPLLTKARSLALEVRSLSFVSADPATDICRTAEAKQASVVLLGWHKPLLIEGRLGGTVREVVERSSSSVAVLVDRGLTKVERVLVAYSGSAEDREALRLARRLCVAPGVALTLLHVVSPGSSRHRGEGLQLDEVFGAAGSDPSVRLKVVEHPSPPEAAIEEAGQGYDLVILGMGSQWGLAHGLGLRRERILTDSPVSVLVVHAPGARKVPVGEVQRYPVELTAGSTG